MNRTDSGDLREADSDRDPVAEAAEVEQLRGEARRLRLKFGAAIAVVLLTALGLGVLAGGRPVGPGAGRYRPAAADPVAAAVPLLRAYVEHRRGLTYRSAVPVRLVSAARLAELPRASAVPARTAAVSRRDRTAVAVGLPAPPAPAVPAGVRYGAAYYSYTAHAVYVAGSASPATRAQLVFALTVALDDQHFGLLTLTRAAAGNADRLLALDALVDGDGRRVATGFAPGSTPAGATFPVAAGASFVTAVARRGGEPAVDAAFGRAPTASAQILDPAGYARGQGPVTVRPPTANGDLVDRGSFGEVGLARLLSHGRTYLNTPVSGQWRGDSYVTLTGSGGRACVSDTALFADEVARDRVADRLRTALPAGAVVVTSSVDNSLTFRSCSAA